MNTPTFECSQTNTHVVIKIRVPFVNVKEIEYVINGSIFRFYAKPYFLRLNFPHALDTSGKTDSTEYNIDTHIFTAKIGKIQPNLNYPNLNMLTRLLQKPPSQQPTRPLIEVLSSEFSENLKVSPAETFDWEQPINPRNQFELNRGVAQGFNGEYRNVFENNADLLSMIDAPNPNNSSPQEKEELMISQMKKEFMSDHVIFDLVNFQEVKRRMEYLPFYQRQVTDPQFQQKFKWLDDEKRVLKSLPRKEYLVTSNKRVWICLIDIIASYCYNERVNLGQENPESAWNISKLCSSFSWLLEHPSLDKMCENFVLRILCCPLVRNFEMAVACLKDVLIILRRKEMVLRCLLKIHKLFLTSDYSIFSKIFVKDYCVWVQSLPNAHFGKVHEMLSRSIGNMVRTKYDVTKVFCLKEIEEYARDEIEEKRKSRGIDEEGPTEL